MKKVNNYIPVFLSFIYILIFSIVMLLCPETSNAETNNLSHDNKSITLITPVVFGDESDWNNIIVALRNLNFGDQLNLEVNGFGGLQNLETRIGYYIDKAKKRGAIVNMKLVGEAHSAHAYLLCHASNFTMEDNSGMMFHNPLFFDSYFFGLIPYRNQSINDNINKVLHYNAIKKCKDAKMLSNQDIEDMNNNLRVIYVKKDGVIERSTNYEPETGILYLVKSFVKIIFIVCLLGFFIRGIIK